MRGRYPTLPFEFPSHQGRGDKEGVIQRKGGERDEDKDSEEGREERDKDIVLSDVCWWLIFYLH